MIDRILPQNAKLVPEKAKLVFKGVIFDIYQWDQELFDGSFAVFEMIKRADSVVVIALDDNNQVVTIDEEQPNGLFRVGGLPVGSAEEKDSSALAAAQREFQEETGMIFKNWKLVQVRQPEIKMEWFVYVFAATGLVSTGEQNLDPGEKIRVSRANYHELLINNPHQKPVLKQFPTPESLRAFVENE